MTGFTAYNGLFPSNQTNAITTFYSSIDGQDAAGPLKDIATGVELSASLSTQQLGVVFDSNGSQPAPGTDVDELNILTRHIHIDLVPMVIACVLIELPHHDLPITRHVVNPKRIEANYREHVATTLKSRHN